MLTLGTMVAKTREIIGDGPVYVNNYELPSKLMEVAIIKHSLRNMQMDRGLSALETIINWAVKWHPESVSIEDYVYLKLREMEKKQ